MLWFIAIYPNIVCFESWKYIWRMFLPFFKFCISWNTYHSSSHFEALNYICTKKARNIKYLWKGSVGCLILLCNQNLNKAKSSSLEKDSLALLLLTNLVHANKTVTKNPKMASGRNWKLYDLRSLYLEFRFHICSYVKHNNVYIISRNKNNMNLDM